MTDIETRSQIITGLQKVSQYFRSMRTVGYDGDMDVYVKHQAACSAAIRFLKKQAPKAPVHIHEKYEEHQWKKDEYGNVDMFGLDYDYHNGPACERCGYSFCVHCNPNGWEKIPCEIDYYKCPSCGNRTLKKQKYCDKCGQEMIWDG